MSRERSQDAPTPGSPTASCVEPPPTSQTATVPSSIRAEATAPSYARRASSSRRRTRTGADAAASRRLRSSLPFSACRPGEATSTSSRVQPSLRASAAKDETSSAAARSRSSEIAPWSATSSPSRTQALRSSRKARPPAPVEATSRRIVFDPTSMTATRMPTRFSCGARLTGGDRLVNRWHHPPQAVPGSATWEAPRACTRRRSACG